jgi:hypothetical protein
MAPHTRVFCSRGDRLGARLKNLLYALDFSLRIDGTLMLNWPPNGRCIGQEAIVSDEGDYRFFDLFDETLFREQFPNTLFTAYTAADYVKRTVGCDGAILISQIMNQPRGFFEKEISKDVVYDLSHRYQFQDQEPNSEPAMPLAEIFSRLPLHPAIERAVEQVVSAGRVEEALCLHVRRGDIVELLALNSAETTSISKHRAIQINHFALKYAPLGAYLRAIEDLAGDRPILVFSDDPAARHELETAAAGRAIDHETLLTEHSLSAHQRDFVEILLIARSWRQVGLRSAFVELGAALGGQTCRSLRPYIDASTLINDLHPRLATSPAGKEIYRRVMEAYCFYYRKEKLNHISKELELHLQTATCQEPESSPELF